MDEWIGYVIFIGFALFSMAAKLKKPPQRRSAQGQAGQAEQDEEQDEEQEQAPRPKWPGPVAGGPFGFPGSSYPRPVQAPKLRPIVAETSPEAASGEGVSMQGASAGEPFRRASYHRPTPPLVTQDETEPAVDFQAVMADRTVLAQAFVMAEVLGKPKALQGRRRR